MDPLSIYDHLPQRKNIRFKGHDYSQPGGYFVTICTLDMAKLFGTIRNRIFSQSTIGKIVHEEWFNTSTLRKNVKLYEDEFILMPNHIHGIIWIIEREKSQSSNADCTSKLKSDSLGAIIGQFKSKTTRRINLIRKTPGKSIWQRSYFDHIIRNNEDLKVIRKYILDNPLKWGDL